MIIKYKDFKIGKENKVELVGLYKEDYIPFSEKNVFFNTKEEENESYYVDPYIIDFKKEGKLPDYLYIDAYIYSYSYYEDLGVYEVIICIDPCDAKENEVFREDYLLKKLA